MDHQKLLEKYMSYVQYNEGILSVPHEFDRDFTKEEHAELKRIAEKLGWR